MQGVYVALITPIKETGEIDHESLSKMMKLYKQEGVSGVFVASSVGEATHFSFNETKELLETVFKLNGGDLELYAGVTSTSSRNAKEVGMIAKKIGYQGIVSAPPYFYEPSSSAIVTYYQELSNQVDLPIIVYNVPLFAPAISRETFEALISIKNVKAVKDSSGSLVDMMHNINVLERNKKNISTLVGREEMFYAALLSGAQGCMVATAGIVPEAYILIEKLVFAQRLEEALLLQKTIVDLVDACFVPVFPAGFKLALKARKLIESPKVIRTVSEIEEEVIHNNFEIIEQQVKVVIDTVEKIKQNDRSVN